MEEPINGWEFQEALDDIAELQKHQADKESGKQWFYRSLVIIILTQIASAIVTFAMIRGGG